MCTMQAPHNPVPQPNLVPVSLRSSRITHNNGVAGGASVAAGLPFTMKFVAIASSLDPRGAKAFAGLPDHPAGWERLQWPPVGVSMTTVVGLGRLSAIETVRYLGFVSPNRRVAFVPSGPALGTPSLPAWGDCFVALRAPRT